jgi:hypothetical protein
MRPHGCKQPQGAGANDAAFSLEGKTPMERDSKADELADH